MLDINESVGVSSAFFWAVVSISGLLVGSLIGIKVPLSHRSIARTMALAAGMLIAAAALELSADAIEEVSSLTVGVSSLIAGALVFSFLNSRLGEAGAGDRKRCGECVAQPEEAASPGSGLAIALGTMIDAIPESLVLGLTLKTSGPELGLILAIALGNLPEAISSSAGMLHAKRKALWIFGLWAGVAIISIALVLLGYFAAGILAPTVVACMQLFGAGALIALVTETLIPEAADGDIRYAGIISALGFAVLLVY